MGGKFWRWKSTNLILIKPLVQYKYKDCNLANYDYNRDYDHYHIKASGRIRLVKFCNELSSDPWLLLSVTYNLYGKSMKKSRGELVRSFVACWQCAISNLKCRISISLLGKVHLSENVGSQDSHALIADNRYKLRF